MATIKFWQEMQRVVTIDGQDKLMIGKNSTGEAQYVDFEQAKQFLTIENSRIKAVDPGPLPTQPNGQTRYMEVTAVGTWTYGGTTIGTNSDGYQTTFWWDGTAWSNNGSVRVKGDDGVTPTGTDVLEPELIPKGKAILNVLYTSGEYNGAVYNRYVNASGTYSGGSGYDSYAPIPVSKGDKVKVWATTGTTLPALFGMNNSDITQATVKQNLLIGNTIYNGVELTIEDDSITYVVASSRNENFSPPATVLLKVELTRNKVDIVKEELDNIDIYPKKTFFDSLGNTNKGKVIRSDTGTITTVSSRPNQSYSDFIKVSAGDRVLISSLFSASVGVAGFDASMVHVSRISDSTTNSLFQVTAPNDFEITIPSGVEYIIISTLDEITNPIKLSILKPLSKILEENKNPAEVLEYKKCYYSVDVDGYNSREAIYVYVKLEGSLDLYVRYNVYHVYDMSDMVYLDYYRIVGASLYQLTNLGMSSVDNSIVWTDAESEFTMLQLGKSDHVGGYHGNEVISSVEFLADGKVIDLSIDLPLTGCDIFNYRIKSTLHEAPNESSPTTPIVGHPIIATHFKNVFFKNSGIEINNSVTFTETISMKRAYIGLICQHKNFASKAYNEIGDYALMTGGNAYVLQNSGASYFYGTGVLGSVEINTKIISLNKTSDKNIQFTTPYMNLQPMYVHDRPNDDKYYKALGYRSSAVEDVINVEVGENWNFKCEVRFSGK